jgi:ABC-type ATPase with predicted acetyltransferase domain
LEIKSLISRAELSYYKLIIVVGKSGSGKTTLLRRISEELHIPMLNLGLELSRRLLSLTNKQRKLMAAEIIEEILDEQGVSTLLIDNTEVIFDTNLKLNSSGLLKNISRNRLLVWSWNGEQDGDHLIYSYAGHPEYHRIPSNEFITITT